MIKIGVFGAGRGIDIAENFMLLDCEIVALCEFNENRAEEGIKKLGIEVPVYKDFDEFIKTFNEKAGFVKAMWCGDRACEDTIKDKLSVTSRCMPFKQETLADTCVCCGKPAKKMVYWGRAY